VTIVDENDNAPVFQQPHYEVVLDEGPDTVNASLITIQALDLDEGPNGTVTYAIIAGNIINTFRIGRHSVSSRQQGLGGGQSLSGSCLSVTSWGVKSKDGD
jgi:hypothetical protein